MVRKCLTLNMILVLVPTFCSRNTFSQPKICGIFFLNNGVADHINRWICHGGPLFDHRYIWILILGSQVNKIESIFVDKEIAPSAIGIWCRGHTWCFWHSFKSVSFENTAETINIEPAVGRRIESLIKHKVISVNIGNYRKTSTHEGIDEYSDLYCSNWS